MGGSAWAGAPLAFVKVVLALGFVHHASAKDHTDQPIVVCFEEIDCPQLVQLLVAGLLFNHYLHNLAPSLEGTSMGCRHVEHCNLCFYDAVGDSGQVIVVGFEDSWGEKCFVVSEVLAGRRGGGHLFPFLEEAFEVIGGDEGRYWFCWGIKGLEKIEHGLCFWVLGFVEDWTQVAR